jgi:carbon starvation protein
MLMEGIVALTSLCTVGVLFSPLPPPGGARYVAGATSILGMIAIPTAFASAWAAQFIGIQHITLAQMGLRFGRMALSELLGGKIRAFRNKYVCIAPVIILWILLGHTRFGAIADYIWRMGGGVNQLQAGLALTLITVWMIARRKPWWFTGIPMAFMLVTTIVSLIYSAWTFLDAAAKATTAMASVGLYGATIISGILICLGIAMVYECSKAISRSRAAMAAAPAAAAPTTPARITPAPERSEA